jgi:hypothetical protein
MLGMTGLARVRIRDQPEAVGDVGERVVFVGEGGEGDGEVVDVGVEVGGCGAVGFVVVSGVFVGDGVAVVAFDPGEGGVAEPVGGDALFGDPGEVGADAVPEMVVAAGGQWGAVAVAQ